MRNQYHNSTTYTYFFLFSLINISHMERINKATLFVNLLFFGTKKEEIYKNRLRLGVAVLGSEYTFVFRERKELLNYSIEKWDIRLFVDMV